MAGQDWYCSLGLFEEHEDALLTVSEETGRTRDDLLLCPNVVCRSLQGQRNAVAQHAFWFQNLYMAYATPDEVAYQVICAT